MRERIRRWLEELERKGVVKRKEVVVTALVVIGCIAAAAGIVLLALAWRR